MMDRRSFIARAPFAVSIPASVLTAPIADPIVGLWADMQDCLAREAEACRKPGNGNFDSPEMRALEAERTALEQKVLSTEITTLEGAAAKVEWLNLEISNEMTWHGHAALIADVARFMRGVV